ncbi:SAV_6107 family HEPN domain-containing protein [Demetria terragena]|uniref:SAV_6107 family HEPN domain-containing protein n=1 Tax=Demetria terragena TaxID=63959 RepID=UPI000362A658|nr:SAV_6107 family HEPN domain-containing protein [Demetria terragena]
MTATARLSAPASAPAGVAPTASAVLDLIDRSRSGLRAACHAQGAGERYTLAHLAALRAAGAMLAAQGRVGRRARPRSVWELIPAAVPEFTEWAAFFAGSGRRRQAIERGVQVSTREADDLVRQSETFLDLVCAQLGLPVHASVTTCVAPITHG